MKTKQLLIVVLSFFYWSLSAQVKLEPVSNMAYLAKSDQSSAKALVVDMGNELIVVDALYGELANEFKIAVDKLNKPIKYVINTHYHGDHTQGNILFRDVLKIAHHNTLKNILDSAQYGPEVPPFSNKDLPDLIVYDSLTLRVQNENIRIWHFGPSHTNGDLVVFFEEKNIIHLGDIVLAPGALPYSISPQGLVATLEDILPRINDQTKVVLGHGEAATKHDLQLLLSIVKETILFVTKNDDLNAYPKEWDMWNSSFINVPTWLKILSQSIKKN